MVYSAHLPTKTPEECEVSMGFFVRDYVSGGDTSFLSEQQQEIFDWAQDLPEQLRIRINLCFDVFEPWCILIEFIDFKEPFLIDPNGGSPVATVPSLAERDFADKSFDTPLGAFKVIVKWYENYFLHQ